MTQLKNTFSIPSSDVERGRGILGSMVKDLQDKFPNQTKTKSQPTQSGPATSQAGAPETQQGPASNMPLSLENLKQQQEQLQQQQQLNNKMHQRTASRGSATPAAPTQSQPPIHWPASSPHGAPAYIGKAPVTQDNLHIPARKKQKANNNVPGNLETPGSNASPQVTKMVSPEVKRQPIVDSKSITKPSLHCPVVDCDSHNIGFESQEALKNHTQKAHVEPESNPLKYAQETLAGVLGLDADGNLKVTKEATPNIKAGTPMSRQGSMIRQGSTNDPKSKVKADAGKAPALSSQAATAVDPWANSTIDPQELFATFKGFDSGLGGISDMNMYRSITPNESPESDQTAVTDTSDLSDGVGLDISLDINFDDSWQPFDGGDIDGLGGGLNDFDFGISGEEDIAMPTVEDDPSMMNFQTWDDAPQDFDRPYEFDTTGFSMNI